MLNHLSSSRPRRSRQREMSVDGRVLRHLDGLELKIHQIAAELRLEPEPVYQALLRLRDDDRVSCPNLPGSPRLAERDRPWRIRRAEDNDTNTTPV